MKLERIDIRSLAGLDEPVSIRFATDGVNFITGPNASGKSSIIRAVRALLYPELTENFCQIRARWHMGEALVDSERHGQTVTWTDGTRPMPPPQLPPAESIGAYLISSEDLTRLGSTDTHIAAAIRTMLAGGYDLNEPVATPPLAPAVRPQKRARELAELGRRIEEKEREYERLTEAVDSLTTLKDELRRTAEAARRLEACEDALALADAVARRTALEHTLIEEFPGGMDRLSGDELSRLDQAEERIAERRGEHELVQTALTRASGKLERGGGVDPQQLEAVQSELASARDQLAELERRIEQQAVALERADEERSIAAKRLGARKITALPEISQQILEEIERYTDRVLARREKIRALSGELARVHAPVSDQGVLPDALRQARDALADWLELSRLSPLEGVLWGGLTVSSGLAGWRLLGPQDVPAHPELVLLILVAMGVPLGLSIRFVMRFRALGQARAQFEQTGVEAPLGWSEGEVETRLERLEKELELATHQAVQRERTADIRERLNQERDLFEQARKRLEECTGKLGLDPDSRLETGFLLWARHLQDWQQADCAFRQHRDELARAREQHAACRRRVGELLHRHGIEDPSEITSRNLSSLIHQLAPRIRANAELHNEIKASRHRLKELEADIETLQGRARAVYEQAGVKPGARRTLIERLEKFEEWRQLEQQRRELSTEITRLEQRLSTDGELLEQARSQQREALSERRDGLAAEAATRDDINRQIASIQTRHEDAIERHELTALTHQYESLRLALGAELERHLLSAAGKALLDDVRQAHQADNEPAALRAGARWFQHFTHYRYRLLFEQGRFAAFDARAERAVDLAELSTATRAQLLLALRLAWIEQAERNRVPLPVFLDEVLTTSDPDRYRQVVESIQEIAAAGRQMFYLTAQPGEAAAWSEWLGESAAPCVIDMAQVRRDQVAPLELTMPDSEARRRDVPQPNGQSPVDWARQAGINPINPWLGTGEVSVFHLLHDDLALAARLIRLELGRIGELTGYLEADCDEAVLDAATRKQLGQRCHAASLVLDDWRRRHHRPVDAGALDAFGQISDTFMPRVLKLLEAVGNHPVALVEGLREGRVARFRSDVTDALEQWLEENGYLATVTDDPAITAAELASLAGLKPEKAAELREWIVSAIDDPLSGVGD